ncbi:HpcH/HpaI aldolase/citrate lyase family protein [Pseudoroseicyclus tamaricis]|uniref:CoA ester lyase n=1 Tax=Pseudoroseicyclus tamaricis TaxID=2705421 RepID=A0A6B2JQ45_9RHOB|nr:CoA ester lyase [Pseudoroseicyclus tamaricis]NDV00248.1 CoA ester lyase [Pseudoroseicyclus tamaricis]
MRLRSLLFVPGDRADRFDKAARSGADALILDLEDSVSPERKAEARGAVAAFLSRPGRPLPLFVRVNPLGTEALAEDLAIAAARPDGLVLPKAEGAADVAALAERAGGLPILPIATETPRAVFALGSYAEAAPHLAGLTWGAEDLPAAIGATASRDEAGFLPPYQMLRALTLFAAHAAGVPAIETVHPDIADEGGLARVAAAARRDGFTGMMAIHPAQIAAIHAAFTPGEAEVAAAREIVAAFAAAPGAGALRLGGKMIDRPHLTAARRLLEAAESG